MAENSSFESLGMPDFLVSRLKESQIVRPTEVQAEAIPLILEGKDVIGRSPTGTGKTLAYLLPVMTRLTVESKALQGLILAPTRELVMQITRLANELMGDRGILTIPVLGGVNIDRQLDSLKKKPQLVAGTPGRTLELIRKRKINAQTIKTIVIDEADKMWQMGFKEDVEAIIKTTLRDRQVVMVSATVSPELVTAAMNILHNPAMVNISQESQLPETIEHIYFMSQEKNKADVLRQLIRIYNPPKAIVFINSNKGVKPFVKRFADFGLSSVGLNSDLSAPERKRVLDRFRSGQARILVTTDIFARGMDVKDNDIVFNFDLPVDSQHYIHRAGRTGRAGKAGLAISFVTVEQKFIMAKYEDQLGINISEYGIAADKVVPVKKKLQEKTMRKGNR